MGLSKLDRCPTYKSARFLGLILTVFYVGVTLLLTACNPATQSLAAVSTATLPPPSATPISPPSSSATVTPTPTATRVVVATPTATVTPPPFIKRVVIISIDGLRPDAAAQADTPTLDTLQAQGAYAPSAHAVLPSVTLVNHASMLSGMSPQKHGIYWNKTEPELGKIKGPTLFSVAHEAGFSTAMVVGKPKLEHLVLTDTVDTYIYAGFTDRQVVDEALPLIESNMPDLLFIHLPDVDSAGHALGWMSAAQLLAVSHTDSLIGEIIAALKKQGDLEQTLLIITSDHGGSGFKHGSDSPEDSTIFWLAVGPGVPPGITLSTDVITYDTAATALYALNLPLPERWDGQPVLEIFASTAD